MYSANKLKTLFHIVRSIHNWPTAVGMRLRRHHRTGLRLLAFRTGLNVVLRTGTRDWDVLHEIAFAGGYSQAFEFASHAPTGASVLDLGGNIGLFGLMCARHAPNARIFSYEPGPPNFRLYQMNCLANPESGARIELRREAVGGTAREDDWFFDEDNPGGSSLFGKEGQRCRVRIAAFSDVIASLPQPIALVKIDVEGAEYEILRQTPPDTWRKLSAVSLELHDDPQGKMTKNEFLSHIRSLGFEIEEESVCSYFLSRSQGVGPK